MSEVLTRADKPVADRPASATESSVIDMFGYNLTANKTSSRFLISYLELLVVMLFFLTFECKFKRIGQLG